MSQSEAIYALKEAHEAFSAAAAARQEAILESIRERVALRTVSEITGLSHESVRRIAQALWITFVLDGHEYPVTKHQADAFIYKLAGFDVGKFPDDVALLEALGASKDWVAATGDLARAVERVKNGEEEGPITLDDESGRAFYQVLRLSYTDYPSDVSRLRDALGEKYGGNPTGLTLRQAKAAARRS
jgi:hypothetical protein